jgi:Flp pilus assembly protein, pilin Flp
MNIIKRELLAFLKDESGVGVVEIILILVVLVALVLIFRDQLKDLVDAAFKKINKDSKSIYK